MKKPWTFATDCKELRQEFDGKICRKDHDHAKCLKDRESYNRAIVKSIHKAFKKHQSRLQGQQDYSRVLPVATATRTRVPLASFSDQRRTMAASSSQVLTLAERKSRFAAFTAAVSDPDRCADAKAGLTEPAWVKDVLKAVVGPTSDDDRLGMFLDFIPNMEWLHLRGEMPNADWPDIVEEWCSRFGLKFDLPTGEGSRIVSDAALAGCAQLLVTPSVTWR